MSQRAVFLDRDGTMIEESGYLDRLERLSLFPYTIDAVRQLNRAGFLVVVVTNQAGIARGIVQERFVLDTHRYLSERLSAGGARVDRYYYCPHHPDAAIDELRQRCECRKPLPGMWQAAARDLDLDLTASFTVGDRWLDMAAGRAAGTRCVLVRSGYGATEETTPRSGLSADVVVDNLAAAAGWVLQQASRGTAGALSEAAPRSA